MTKHPNPDAPRYATEAEMCAHFMEYAGIVGWACYPETAGWDVLCVRRDGYQLGVQAKLRANVQVLQQAVARETWTDGPDFRAVLVPRWERRAESLRDFSPYIGVTVITARGPGKLTARGEVRHGYGPLTCFEPALPDESQTWWRQQWFEALPSRRHRLPEYIPDVKAGAPSPTQLTAWKISAIKIAILLERYGAVTRADFKALGIDHRRWVAAGSASWLQPDRARGGFVLPPNSGLVDGFKREHPRNYGEIAADFEKWNPRQAAIKLL